MKGTMKKIIVMTATAVMIMVFAIPVYAGTKYKATCASPGCEYERSDHSSYCRLHTCQETDCYSYRNNGSVYCDRHAREKLSDRKGCCEKYGCYRSKEKGSSYCKEHGGVRSSSSSTKKIGSTYTGSYKKSNSSSKKKKADTYNVYDYKSAQEFADDKYEEFYDYEDDYEDEDEAYDAAEDYWYDHH